MSATPFKQVATHAAKFHADDVCSIAFLRIIGLANSETKIVRSLEADVWDASDIVLDVGRKYDPDKFKFDHHQPEFTLTRECGTPYASFGLVVKHFGNSFLSPEELQTFDHQFVRYVDALDTGYPLHTGAVLTISDLVDYFNPSWDEPSTLEDFDKQFMVAVDLVEIVMRRAIRRIKSTAAASNEIETAIRNSENPEIVVLHKYLPWKDYVCTNCPQAKFIIYPHLRGGYAAEVVPIAPTTYESRAKFPIEWSGLANGELEKICGVSGATFCHKERFIIANKTFEGIEEMVNIALQSTPKLSSTIIPINKK